MVLILSLLLSLEPRSKFVNAQTMVLYSNQLRGELRIDTNDLKNALGYRSMVMNTGIIPTYDGTTLGWLGLDLGIDNGSLYSGLFSQTGVYADATGLHWFVYAEPGVVCNLGISQFGTCLGGLPCGCIGSDYVDAQWPNWFEISKETPDHWAAYIFDHLGTKIKLAEIQSANSQVYYAQLNFEESYEGFYDPIAAGGFLLSDPQYKNGNNFDPWLAIDGAGRSVVYPTDLNGSDWFCPQVYGGIHNYPAGERSWFAGSGGQACRWLLFPSQHIYVPIINN
jgi:hypothetical protein